MDVHIYVEIDSANMNNTEKWFGYVLECKLHGQIVTRDGFNHAKGTYHQITLVAVAEALARLKEKCVVSIHAQNEFVLRMLENNLEHWANVEFVTTKGKPLANRNEWIRIWELSKDHLILIEPGKHTYSDWLATELKNRKESYV